jgi:hypothetical protein
MKTPRTDQMESTFLECKTSEVDDVFVFARNLEIELNDAENRIKRLEDHIDRLEQCGNSLFNGLTRDQAMKRWIQVKRVRP